MLMTLCGEVLFSSLLQSRLHLLNHGNQPDAEQSILDEKQQAYSRMQVLRPPSALTLLHLNSIAHLEALCIQHIAQVPVALHLKDRRQLCEHHCSLKRVSGSI